MARKKCEHGRERSRCKECGGSSICEHGRRRGRCKECGPQAVRPPKRKLTFKEEALATKRKVLSDSNFEAPEAAAKVQRSVPRRATAAKASSKIQEESEEEEDEGDKSHAR